MLSDYLKGLVIFFMVFMGIFTFINVNAGKFGYQSYNNPIVNKVLSDTQQISSQMEQEMRNLQTSSGITLILDYFGVAFSGTINILKLFITTLPTTILALITNLTTTLSLPSWVSTGLFMLFLISVISLIIFVLMKVRL